MYNYVDFDSDKTKPASEVRAILKRFSDFLVHIFFYFLFFFNFFFNSIYMHDYTHSLQYLHSY